MPCPIACKSANFSQLGNVLFPTWERFIPNVGNRLCRFACRRTLCSHKWECIIFRRFANRRLEYEKLFVLLQPELTKQIVEKNEETAIT